VVEPGFGKDQGRLLRVETNGGIEEPQEMSTRCPNLSSTVRASGREPERASTPTSGTGVLKVDGKEVATQRTEHTLPFIKVSG
jgi:hypothetical protein